MALEFVADNMGYFGRQYDTWRLHQQVRRENRLQRRLKRHTERQEALARKREWAGQKRAYKAELKATKSGEKTTRDQRRGFSVDYKRVCMAYGVEVVMASTSAYGQYLFAQQYGTDWLTTQQMFLAPIGYAMLELCRVPLALSVRIHRQWLIRWVALAGVIGAACITVKSMSQLGNMMFAPRLTDVVIARENLDLAQAADDQIIQRIGVADALLKQRLADQRLATEKEMAASSQLAGLPKPACYRQSWFDKRTNEMVSKTVCPPDPRGTTLTSSLKAAQATTQNAQKAYEAAVAERESLDRTGADEALAKARTAYREAVRKSQLHDFASMVWGISPSEVTDSMVAQFLRWFVFGAAICVAFASTMIAFTAVTRVKPAKPNTIRLDDRNGEFILEPFAEKVIAEAKAAVNADAEAKIARASSTAKADTAEVS